MILRKDLREKLRKHYLKREFKLLPFTCNWAYCISLKHQLLQRILCIFRIWWEYEHIRIGYLFFLFKNNLTNFRDPSKLELPGSSHWSRTQTGVCPSSRYTKFSENEHLLPPDQKARNINFSENYAYVLNVWSRGVFTILSTPQE